MNDPRHRLDIYRLDWRVATPGFRPISIKFEVDRVATFRILSGEIYRGDARVFLRELLQNSIDAIRMRRTVLRRAGLTSDALGRIDVVLSNVDGKLVLTWQDDGIGMDEHIVRNYFAVAGKSYYRSREFEKCRLPIDPISQFGVGVLSCFMVSDALQIETYRDPYLAPEAVPLRISIPGVERQFRIEERARTGARVGTTVTVPLRSDTIDLSAAGALADLLIKIGGFSEFPIRVIDRGDESWIIKPQTSVPSVAVKVSQLDLGSNIQDIVLPQDLATASEAIKSDCFDLSEGSALEGYEGLVTYHVLRDENYDIVNSERAYPVTDVIVVNRHRPEMADRLRWSPRWRLHAPVVDEYEDDDGDADELSLAKPVVVFRDGIRVPEPGHSRYERAIAWSDDLLNTVPPIPKLTINVSKKVIPRLDVARKATPPHAAAWDTPIWSSIVTRLRDRNVERLRNANPIERMHSVAWLKTQYHLKWSDVAQFLGDLELPGLVLSRDGYVHDIALEDLPSRLDVLPDALASVTMQQLYSQFFDGVARPVIMNYWQGEAFLSRAHPWHHLPEDTPAALLQMLELNERVAAHHFSAGVRFLRAPSADQPPMLQRFIERPPDITQWKHNFVGYSASVHAQILRRSLLSARFEAPFADKLAYGWALFNSEHPVGKDLSGVLRLTADPSRKGADDIRMAQLRDLFEATPFGYGTRRSSILSIQTAQQDLLSLAEHARALGLWEGQNREIESISLTDFVPQSLEESERGSLVTASSKLDVAEPRPFGQPLGLADSL